VDVDSFIVDNNVYTNRNNITNSNTNEKKRKRVDNEELEVHSNSAKKQKMDVADQITSQLSSEESEIQLKSKSKKAEVLVKPELNQSMASIQASEDDVHMTANTTSFQVSEEEEETNCNEVIAVEYKSAPLILSVDSKEEQFDNRSMSSHSSGTTSIFAKFKFAGLKKYAKVFEENGYDDLDYLIELVDDEAEFNKMLNVCGIDKPGHIDQLKKSLLALKS